ncbi:MAG: hypothetical protein OGMRLDGQ_002745 [Candidatus Fervidibacter sp.]
MMDFLSTEFIRQKLRRNFSIVQGHRPSKTIRYSPSLSRAPCPMSRFKLAATKAKPVEAG